MHPAGCAADALHAQPTLGCCELLCLLPRKLLHFMQTSLLLLLAMLQCLLLLLSLLQLLLRMLVQRC
jgi:hypothetical protein